MSAPQTLANAGLHERLLGMTTATATALLDRRGYTQQFMSGALPIQQGGRACGRAVTVRLGPSRPDLQRPQSERAHDPLWQAVEAISPGDFLVIDCGADVRAGTTGDILTARIQHLGGVGIVCDGALRDAAQIREFVHLPCWTRGVHGSGFTAALVSLDRGMAVRCFGVTVVPGDFLLGDDDGIVVIPASLAEEIAVEGSEQELKESFIRELVQQGVPTSECYPPNADVLRRFEEWRRGRA
ncbi:MAG: ribonuclease activity regulator RraA [Chloroflexi bacterium]|nr:ribonuclease activity regulator RraA [Chloroflexota bacterium]MBV9547468.1 ribonuclease activity regulator RraA [Chloroflexota bacterium]